MGIRKFCLSKNSRAGFWRSQPTGPSPSRARIKESKLPSFRLAWRDLHVRQPDYHRRRGPVSPHQKENQEKSRNDL